MRAQKSGGILFKLAQHLWQIKAHLGLSLLEFIFYSSLSSHIDPTHATRWIKVFWLRKVLLCQLAMLLPLSVTSAVSLPPEAKKKQLFWVCTNKRSCFYSNHRTLLKIFLCNTSPSLLFKPASLPFVNQQTALTQKGHWMIWLHIGVRMTIAVTALLKLKV